MQHTFPADPSNSHRMPAGMRPLHTRARAILAELVLEVQQSQLGQEERAFLATNHGGAYAHWYGEA